MNKQNLDRELAYLERAESTDYPHPSPSWLIRHLCGYGTTEQRQEVDQHVTACPTCQAELARCKATIAESKADTGMKERVSALIVADRRKDELRKKRAKFPLRQLVPLRAAANTCGEPATILSDDGLHTLHVRQFPDGSLDVDFETTDAAFEGCSNVCGPESFQALTDLLKAQPISKLGNRFALRTGITIPKEVVAKLGTPSEVDFIEWFATGDELPPDLK